MARAKDHILLDAIRGRGLHDVFRQARTDTNPSCECEQCLGAELRAETPDDVGSVVAGEAEREWVVEHPGWGFFSMQRPRDRGQHGGAARPAGGERHGNEMLGSLMSRHFVQPTAFIQLNATDGRQRYCELGSSVLNW